MKTKTKKAMGRGQEYDDKRHIGGTTNTKYGDPPGEEK